MGLARGDAHRGGGRDRHDLGGPAAAAGGDAVGRGPERPAASSAAAREIGFRPATQPGVGEIEDGPAEAAPEPSAPGLLPVGSEAPPFILKTPAGRTVSLTDYRGKAVLLEFFASWCPHCAAEAPHLAKLAELAAASRSTRSSRSTATTRTRRRVFAFHIYFGAAVPVARRSRPRATSRSRSRTTARAGRCRARTGSATSRPST